jgi:heptosyltransferase-2
MQFKKKILYPAVLLLRILCYFAGEILKRWNKITAPEKILFIRLQATGDMVATLPYIQSMKAKMADNTVIDFLTREETCSIPESLLLFNRIHVLRGGRSSKKQLFYLLQLLPLLRKIKYDAVIDLQNNRISRICRKLLRPGAWVEFDKYSPIHGCERYRRTINEIGIVPVEMDTRFRIKNKESAVDILRKNGWDEQQPLIVINPAGAFVTRNWPLEFYVRTCRLFLEQINPSARFLILGLQSLKEKAANLKGELGETLIDLTGKTTPAEAFAIVQYIRLMISEDSGLMHMAYLSGIPTIGLLGSTRNDWTDPCLEHTRFFHSADLACGNCMAATCIHGDVRCLTRVKPEMLIEKAKELLGR